MEEQTEGNNRGWENISSGFKTGIWKYCLTASVRREKKDLP